MKGVQMFVHATVFVVAYAVLLGLGCGLAIKVAIWVLS